MLGKLIDQHGSRVWLVNTGWSGGAYGVGKRMKLAYTRALVRAALAGQLDNAPTRTDPLFGLAVPEHVPGIPDEILRPRDTWSDGNAYDAQAKKLAEMFRTNFEKFGEVDSRIRDAGPKGA
jgi:phosphoenolpyruvate carboxykinase (ATP)